MAAETDRQRTTDQVWHALDGGSFAVLSHVTPGGQPRSSGVMYLAEKHRLYVVVAADSWKARHITGHGRVAVTVPIRRGGLLSLLFPIPPATISFHAEALVHPAGSLAELPVPARLARMLPLEAQRTNRVIELRPVGEFVTYGVGIPLRRMRTPALSRGRAPVG